MLLGAEEGLDDVQEESESRFLVQSGSVDELVSHVQNYLFSFF